VSPELRGTAYGLYSLVSGVSFFVSDMAFGFLWDVYGVNFAALYSLCLSIVAITGMTIFLKNKIMMISQSLILVSSFKILESILKDRYQH
jgi:hypothetical protein